MGALQSRQLSVEEVDIGINHAYKYPPRTGMLLFCIETNILTVIQIFVTFLRSVF